MKAYKYKKVLELVREFQWDSGNADVESETIASKIVAIFTGRSPKKEFRSFYCKLSQQGIETFKKEREGKVLGESRDKPNWIVLWKGNKSSSSYHKSFIQRIFNTTASEKRLRDSEDK